MVATTERFMGKPAPSASYVYEEKKTPSKKYRYLMSVGIYGVSSRVQIIVEGSNLDAANKELGSMLKVNYNTTYYNYRVIRIKRMR